ncbi:hypothetical protein MITSMUL_04179 [Mitsuokella multacida DSM 20544]|uniref:Uncharacterized protein n=1 Tax=Mitsuokella multacida DSM 20544 TaxID=500635 RepID=C9KLU4_9FIRM|nr:hypothetical protein MITSMUL_04179 [Mitsuokella multacida DSM 20544]
MSSPLRLFYIILHNMSTFYVILYKKSSSLSLASNGSRDVLTRNE